jgi:processive 1,2-diacylglycerol beta-glucosyltransferase
MRILLVNSERFGGVEYYRMLKPNHVIKLNHPEFEFSTIGGFHPTEDIPARIGDTEFLINDDYLKSFDLVHFCRQLSYQGLSQGIADRLNRLGIPFGLDLDDFWELPTHHILYKSYKEQKATEVIIEGIKLSHFVTTTTPYLADEIRKINPNVYILENGIDLEDDSWKPHHVESELMRFGFMLGHTHQKDLQKAVPSILNLLRSNLEGYQIVNAGFDNRYNPEHTSEPIHVTYEKLLTNDLYALKKNPNYVRWLVNCQKDGNEAWCNMPYFRLWGTDVEKWGYMYAFIDLSLVPLVDNKFNNCKSELKMIESGVKGKPCIVSNVKPYTLLADDSNSYLVGDKSFYDQIKRALANPNEVRDKGEKLKEDVLKKYDLKVLMNNRISLYSQFK